MFFKSPKGLTAHLVQHYLPKIEERYLSVLSACPYCEYQHASRPHLLHHIVVNHKKLAEFVPPEVRQMLKDSGVFDQIPGMNGQPQIRAPPPLQPRHHLLQQTQNVPAHPAFQTFGQTDVRKTCPGCDQAFGIQSSLNRHISNVHIKNELLQNCNPNTMQCKLCPGVFKDVRTLVTHVGISHGFIKRFIQMENQRKKTMGANHPSVQAAAQRAQNAQRFGAPQTAEHVNFICPICNKTGFPTWTTWKKHIFHHMSTKIRGHYENIGKDCPICGKHFESFGQNTLHVAVIHNKVFNFLPAEMRMELKRAGLTSNKNKRQINCPLCPEEKGIFGEMTFKQHLYSHCQDRVRRAYAKHGRQCMFCRFVATDVETTVQHIAIYHNKVAEFLPQEVLDSLKSSGVNLQAESGNAAGGIGSPDKKSSGMGMPAGISLLRGNSSSPASQSPFSFPNGSISLTRVSGSGGSGNTSTPKAATASIHPALQPSPIFVKEKPMIYR